MPKAKGGEHFHKGKSTPDIVSGVQTLAELGLEEKQSERWQKVASIPQKLFDDWIANSNAACPRRGPAAPWWAGRRWAAPWDAAPGGAHGGSNHTGRGAVDRGGAGRAHICVPGSIGIREEVKLW